MKLYYEYSISRGKSEGQLQLRNYSANIVHSCVVCGKLWEERSNAYNRKEVCINNKHMLVVREKEQCTMNRPAQQVMSNVSMSRRNTIS